MGPDKKRIVESLVTTAVVVTECIAIREQANKRTFFFIYIYRLKKIY